MTQGDIPTEHRRLSIIVGGIIVIVITLGGFAFYLEVNIQAPVQFVSDSVITLSYPIIHKPTFFGNYSFILGSGVVVENRSAYSYVWINASSLRSGDSFIALPALYVGLVGTNLNENSFTIKVLFTGSNYGALKYWINFSSSIPPLGSWANLSQIGFSSFARTNASLSGFKGAALFFSQISNVVGEGDSEFEYFFYVGNSSTPVPILAHGPVH